MSSRTSAQAKALEVLRAISKSSNTAVQLDDVPEEFLRGSEIRLNRWTMVTTDKNMKQLSEQAEEIMYIDCDKPNIEEFFWDFWNPKPGSKIGVTTLEIVGAKAVTEYGITVVARKNPGLKHLNISGCIQIGDVGLREIGMNCTQLLSLNISGCHHIQGMGLIAIAECCKFLTKLDISKMSNLESYAISKLFYNCKLLEELNFANMNIIGDQEIITLAQNCPNIVYFNAPECTFISDASTQLLAKMCPDLDYVDLSRTSMSSRITDLTLLGFGQSSLSLRILKLKGCEHITDVGLMWLAEGCKVLEELDINNCIKISDAGIRSLANHCLALTSLDITGAKLVSDVGVANISNGCPLLKRLVFSGLYLMCDPRIIVNTKKGEKVDSWNSIIGLQAVAQHSEHLEEIDLTGCFRLNKSIGKFVSRLTSIKKINLTSCNQITTESLCDLFKGCIYIEDINLSDCGECVNSKSITILSKYCKNLKIFISQRCIGLEGISINSLSNIDTLIKLDLSGCKSLTDIMMLPLTEVDKVMDLRTLILINIPLLTDTTLAWFASKTQNIQLMAVKGSSISKHSVQAVRDRFPNSDKLDNENFLGFWPKFRIDDRKMMNKYYYAKQGWIKIQARQRSWLARERVKVIVRKRQIKKAIYILQRMCRLFSAINIVNKKRLAAATYQRKAVVITSIFYIAVAKKRVFRKKQNLHENYIFRIVTLIQTHWRMHYAYKILIEKKRIFNELINKRNYGATKFQSIIRVYFSKLKILHIKQMKKSRILLIEKKTIIIQRVWRGGRGRIKALKRKKYMEWFLIRRDTAAAQIQHKVRIIYTNKLVAERQAKKCLLYKSAKSIQSLIRGFMCRLVLAQEGAEEAEIRQDGAATIMQSAWRRKAAYIIIKGKRDAVIMRQQRVARAAVVVQCRHRKKFAWRKLQKKREEYLELLKARVDMELWGIIKLQCLWRGVVGRRRFDTILRDKKGKWKELFDEEKNKRFFYNKLSGEVRWRMPQDLLDLIPHPKCDNCGFYEALLECGVCNELYCQQCYDQVHYGGRRKDHEFRTLYDFYGKRLDYGDGEFPSKWPSEVIQDEVQGWMLRVAPIRDPIALHNDAWEEYNEINADGSAGRTFYFNRHNFEASYDQPKIVEEYLAYQQQLAEHEAYQQQLAEQAAQDYQGFGAVTTGGGASNYAKTAAAATTTYQYQQDSYETAAYLPQTDRQTTGTGRQTGRISNMQHPPPPAAPPPESARNHASNAAGALTMNTGGSMGVHMMTSNGPRNRILEMEQNTSNTSNMPNSSARGKKDLVGMKRKKKKKLSKEELEQHALEEEKQQRYEDNAFGKKKPSLGAAPFSSR
jgi:hypothetical protein